MTNDQTIKAAVNALPPLGQLVSESQLYAKKSLGQNFLFDLNLTAKIATQTVTQTGTIIEVGPGPGGLTRSLLTQTDASIIAIEKDRRAISFLDHLITAGQGRLILQEADALTAPLWEYGTSPRAIVANLPYNIGTSLLLNWLDHAHHFSNFVLMFQKEVAMRICAKTGSQAYGRLSIITQWLTHTELLFDVPPEAFVPPPKITSSVVRLVPRDKPLFPCDKATLEAVTAKAFSQRRKMLRASFKTLGGADMLQEVGIDPTSRPQDLEISDFCALARHLEGRI
ncbi:MAG: 16S rRNA (adenine(1518)-N(6)/adenine(1519)-N(6))-dimethyltransferase RsmA [Candidatus Puniceispirillaceae bacterium]